MGFRLKLFEFLFGASRGKKACIQAVGIPRTLFYFLHPRLWETFFLELGISVVLSDPTQRATVERAGLISESENCLPVKLLDAHLDSLVSKVDVVFVPRILSTHKGWIACPKLGALPDVVQAQFGDRFRVLTVDVNENTQSLATSLAVLGQDLGRTKTQVTSASRVALHALSEGLRNPATHVRGKTEYEEGPESTGRFLLIGHPYNLYDGYMSDSICLKLESMGAQVQRVTFDHELRESCPLHWDTCAQLYEALHAASRETVDGVIHLASFNCGCDSIAGTLFRELAKELKLPFMTLILDEHSARAGVDTRLEAFMDTMGAIR